MVTHQITDDFLAGYAAGNLPEAFNLLIAAHVSLSPEARERLDAYDQIGGTLLDDLHAVEMSHGSLEATLARITGGVAIEERAQAPAPSTACAVLPAPVRDYVGGGLDAVKWRSLGMGCKQAILAEEGDASVRLLYIPAGSEMPDHGHHGTEMTLVLQGAFLDGDERFARGDVEIADEDTEHRPIADVGDDCICLAACAGGLKFNGLLPRIVQPFFRI